MANPILDQAAAEVKRLRADLAQAQEARDLLREVGASTVEVDASLARLQKSLTAWEAALKKRGISTT